MPDINICIYNGKKYFNPRHTKDTIMIIQRNGMPIDDTYKPHRDLLGNIVEGEFSKTVSYDEVDDFYSIDYIIIYKGMECSVGGLDEMRLIIGMISIFTSDKEMAKQYDFRQFERFDNNFVKRIPLSEVEKLIVIKTWRAGENKGESIRWETDIMSFLENYPDNI